MQTNRSTNYRELWFRKHHTKDGMYRCVYCGKKFKAKDITIDHVIPVHLAQNYLITRLAMRLKGLHDVNDDRNLVPACRKCNRKKGIHIGLYPLRARLGRFGIYWKVIWIIRLACILGLFALGAWGFWMVGKGFAI